MNPISSYTNNVAIGLSALCLLHCLASPLLLVLLPGLSALQLENEAFHTWLLVGVIPTSVFSLFMGCRQHHRYRVVSLGICGLLFLILAVLVGDGENGKILEKILTLIGASIVGLSHYLNFRLCRRLEECNCEQL